MLYWLTVFSDGGDFFNLFRYITFRAGGAFFTALLFGFIFGKNKPILFIAIQTQIVLHGTLFHRFKKCFRIKII